MKITLDRKPDMPLPRICFATNNPNKLAEIRDLLSDKYEIVSLHEIGCKEELPETQETLEGNSLQKAQHVFNHYGVPCFADDTGLEVEALGGRPGVRSARYAGPEKDPEANMALLLKELEGAETRAAQFRTVVTLVGEDGHRQFEGVVKGEILRERIGTEGFGYDPVFRPEGQTLTFAEMPASEKNAISHRGRAVRKLISYLEAAAR